MTHPIVIDESLGFCDDCHHLMSLHDEQGCWATVDLRVRDDEVQWLVTCNCRKKGEPSDG